MIIALARGDITKREVIEWSVCPDEARPWLAVIEREILQREYMIALCKGFMQGPKDEPQRPKRHDQGPGEYCQGKNIEECRSELGDAYYLACATCPD